MTDWAAAVLFELDPRAIGSAQLRYATRFHGGSADVAFALARDGERWVLAGSAKSNDLPVTTNAFAASPAAPLRFDDTDAFLAVLDPRHTGRAQLVYGTYLGGTGEETIDEVRVVAPGHYAFAGTTTSLDLPLTPNTLPPSPRGHREIFLGILDTQRTPTSQLLYATLFGGESDDDLAGFDVDASGALILAGSTVSLHLPRSQGAHQPHHRSPSPLLHDTFFARIDPARSPEKQLVHSTYHGGQHFEFLYGATLAPPLLAISVGESRSPDFPRSSGSLGEVHPGYATLAASDLLPSGVRALGDPSSSCARRVALGADSEPRLGLRAFELWCGGAPRDAFGSLLFAPDVLPQPLFFGILALHLDPTHARALPVRSDPLGRARWSFSIPPHATFVGVPLALQCLSSEARAEGACVAGELSASNALRIVFAR